ncbi:MAG: M15 family metallopeptidase [Bacteroidia bacterium]
MKKMSFILSGLLLIIFGFEACDYFVHTNNNSTNQNHQNLSAKKTAAIDFKSKNSSSQDPLVISKTEQYLIDAGLTDVQTVDSNIVVDLKYSTCDNFLGLDVYGDLNKCYLQPDVAQKIKISQKKLKSMYPFYNLIIFDAVRPRSIQSRMWDTIAVPLSERSKYVSNPKNGSLHNFGAAVDVSIVDQNGIELDMGTAYDYFGELAYPREEERMIKEGKLTHIQLLNRELLRSVMEAGGFSGITTEWWHFNSCQRTEAYSKYKIIE